MLDSASDYKHYAEEARSRDEEELAQFFDKLAQLLYARAEEVSQPTSNNSFKNSLLERWRIWKELIEI